MLTMRPRFTLACAAGRVMMPCAMLEIFELMKDLDTVEGADVLGLNWRQPTDGPAEVHEVRLDGMGHRMHPDLFGQSVALPRVTGAARGHDIAPVVGATTRERNEVIASQRLAGAQLNSSATAVLTSVAVAGEKEGVGDLTSEAARDVDESRKSDHRRARHSQPLRADKSSLVCFNDLGLAVDDEPERALHRHHRKRLERGVQCETPQHHAILLFAELRELLEV